MDEEIKKLGALHGYDELTDAEVKKIKTKLANALIDNILDIADKPQKQ